MSTLGPKAHTSRRILEALKRPQTAAELAPCVHSHKQHVVSLLRDLRAKKLVHIVGWFPTATNFAPIYGLGDGDDAPRPEPATATERFNKMLERMTADDRDRYWIRYNTRRRKVKFDPLVQAFFGVKK